MPIINIKLSAINRDTSIQCRAAIDMALVEEYAVIMSEAPSDFPPVKLFGAPERCWIGDGWHRILAAEAAGLEKISADIEAGGKRDALQWALGSNTAHGQRRTNADKRRCIEIALREFHDLSSNQIAHMCGVSDKTVDAFKTRFGISEPEKVIGADGKSYPAHKETPSTKTTIVDKHEEKTVEEVKAEAAAQEERRYVEPQSERQQAPEMPARTWNPETVGKARQACEILASIEHNGKDFGEAQNVVYLWIEENWKVEVRR